MGVPLSGLCHFFHSDSTFLVSYTFIIFKNLTNFNETLNQRSTSNFLEAEYVSTGFFKNLLTIYFIFIILKFCLQNSSSKGSSKTVHVIIVLDCKDCRRSRQHAPRLSFRILLFFSLLLVYFRHPYIQIDVFYDKFFLHTGSTAKKYLPRKKNKILLINKYKWLDSRRGL